MHLMNVNELMWSHCALHHLELSSWLFVSKLKCKKKHRPGILYGYLISQFNQLRNASKSSMKRLIKKRCVLVGSTQNVTSQSQSYLGNCQSISFFAFWCTLQCTLSEKRGGAEESNRKCQTIQKWLIYTPK